MRKILFVFILAICNCAYAAKNEAEFNLQYNGIWNSVVAASTSPAFYLPAGFAMLAFYDDIGRRISGETREDHPFWGEPERAGRASDNLRTLTSITMLSSSLLFLDKGWSYVFSNMLFDATASFAANATRGALRDGNRRGRPNGKEASFPSGHATAAGARVALANINVFNSNLRPETKLILASLNWTVAYLIAYSRVEAHNHYPEDVLAGIAIGYWVTNVLKRTFTNTFSSKLSLSVDSSYGQSSLQIAYSF